MPKKPDPRKWQDTKEAKKQLDAMSVNVLNQFGYNAPSKKVSSTPTPKPTATKKARINPAEKALNDLMKQRKAEAKKNGSWPNYYTN